MNFEAEVQVRDRCLHYHGNSEDFMRMAPILLFVTLALASGAALGQSFCPHPIVEHPYSAEWVETSDGMATATVEIARS